MKPDQHLYVEAKITAEDHKAAVYSISTLKQLADRVERIFVEAPTLPLAICKFSKQLFKEAKP